MNKRELLKLAIAAVRHKTSPLFHAVHKERSTQKMLFSVTEIDWDTTNDDGNAPECCSCHHFSDLPKTLTIEIDDKYDTNPPLNVSLSNEREYEDIIEDIVNQLSDTYGWCVNNCRIIRVE